MKMTRREKGIDITFIRRTRATTYLYCHTDERVVMGLIPSAAGHAAN